MRFLRLALVMAIIVANALAVSAQVTRVNYDPKAVPTLEAPPDPPYVYTILLPDGETIVKRPVCGDLVHWIVSAAEDRIYVQSVQTPSFPAKTNLLFTTTRGSYEIILDPFGQGGARTMQLVPRPLPSPPPAKRTFSVALPMVTPAPDHNALSHADAAHWRPYRGDPAFKPEAIYRKGNQTYIRLRDDLAQVPAIVTYDERGDAIVLSNYRALAEGGFLIDRPVSHLRLVLGTGRNARVGYVDRL